MKKYICLKLRIVLFFNAAFQEITGLYLENLSVWGTSLHVIYEL